MNTNAGIYSASSEQVQEPIETVDCLAFVVPGVAVPQGSKKGFVVGRRAVIVDDNKDLLKPWRATVRDAAEHALAGRTGLSGAVSLVVTFYIPRPKTVHRATPFVKPDLDKYVRAIGDALTDSGALADDGQIVDLHAHKRYADDLPCVDIRVEVAG